MIFVNEDMGMDTLFVQLFVIVPDKCKNIDFTVMHGGNNSHTMRYVMARQMWSRQEYFYNDR